MLASIPGSWWLGPVPTRSTDLHALAKSEGSDCILFFLEKNLIGKVSLRGDVLTWLSGDSSESLVWVFVHACMHACVGGGGREQERYITIYNLTL